MLKSVPCLVHGEGGDGTGAGAAAAGTGGTTGCCCESEEAGVCPFIPIKISAALVSREGNRIVSFGHVQITAKVGRP